MSSVTPRRLLRPGPAWALPALLLVAACGAPEGPGASKSPIEGIPEEHLTPAVARVNGVTLHEATYMQILEAIRGRIPENHPDAVELFLGAREKALEKAIDEELLFQEAVRRGFGPPDEEVAAVYAREIEKAGSEARFEGAISSRGVSRSEFLTSVRRTLAIERFVKKEIEEPLAATDEEVRAFYDARPDLFTPDVLLKVGHIFVAAPFDLPASKRSAALTRITGVLERLHAGASFESLASEFSEDASRETGGLLGLFKRGGLPESLDRAAFDLAPGAISGIVSSDAGYHILKVYERQGGRLEPFEKVREDARKKLLQKKRGDRLGGIVNSLREGATIERLQSQAGS